jgi:cyclase
LAGTNLASAFSDELQSICQGRDHDDPRADQTFRPRIRLRRYDPCLAALVRAKRYGIFPKDLEGTIITLPTVTFEQDLSIDLGDCTVDLNYPGPSHTSGSITAFVPRDQILFADDILFTNYHVTLVDGDIRVGEVLTKLQTMPCAAIVPGHGPLSSVADLRNMAEYLRAFDTEARRLCQGNTAPDIPAIVRELMPRLPNQGRSELEMIVAGNLRFRYLPTLRA